MNNRTKPNQRKAGVLLPISSLPSPYGIGTLGKMAYEWVDWLTAAGARVWQILPLLPTAYGDSPYASSAANALNYYFIDLDILKGEGLLQEEEYAFLDWGTDARRVDYEKLFHLKIPVLQKAFARFDRTNAAWQTFLEEGEYRDFALFMTLKSNHDYRAWTEWGEYAVYEEEKAEAFARAHAEELEFWQFTQYLFLRQWKKLQEYCHERDIEIMGDMPIYVAFDSVEMWKYGKALFLLDETGSPALVAGVPPDAFSDDGQLWGNPVYDWQGMKENGYVWWKKRIRDTLRLVDVVRIDHFRVFDRFYAVAAGMENARIGEWMDGPKAELFEEFKDGKIVAEDLGVIDEGVIQLMRDTGYPGMKVIEFAFDNNPHNEHKPSNYTSNCVAYTGTHDNMPLLGFLQEKSPQEKARWDEDLVAECQRAGIKPNKGNDRQRCNTVMKLLFVSAADTVVVPLHDLYVLGEEARINLPSTVSTANWSYRFLDGEFTPYYRKKLKNLISYGNRGK